MLFIALILVFIGVILFEVPRLVKTKMWGELAAFFLLLVISMVMTFTAVLNIDLPNPTKFIELVFGPISEVILSFVE